MLQKRLEKFNSDLQNWELRNKHYLDTDNIGVLLWLSSFSKEKQNQIEEIKINYEFIKYFKEEFHYFLEDYIKKTEITGKQINKLIRLLYKNEHELDAINQIRFYDGGISDQIESAKSQKKIDEILNKFEQDITNLKNKQEREKEERQSNSSADWSALFNTTAVDYKKELGLSPMATNEEVRKAFRDLIKILHPDTGGVNSTIFQKYNKMYEDWKKSIKKAI